MFSVGIEVFLKRNRFFFTDTFEYVILQNFMTKTYIWFVAIENDFVNIVILVMFSLEVEYKTSILMHTFFILSLNLYSIHWILCTGIMSIILNVT